MGEAYKMGRAAIILLSTLFLCSCAETELVGHMVKSAADDAPPPSSTEGGVYKIGKPYQVAGVWYYPREDYDYDESGIASWYGPDFHGKLTANGEMFDQNTVTAAHKTLPLPSIVRVTNLENGRSLIVRVNDRGPFVNGRIIDLSRRSAQLLGMENRGTARVRVQVMADESRALASSLKNGSPGNEPPITSAPREQVATESLAPPPGTKAAPPSKSQQAQPVSRPAAGPTLDQRMDAAAAAQSKIGQVSETPVKATGIYVQAGTFARYDNAIRLKATLSPVGQAQIQQVNVRGQPMFRVRFGPMASPEDADKVLDRVISLGQQDARVVVD